MGKAARLSVQHLLGFADGLGEILAAVVNVVQDHAVESGHLSCVLPVPIGLKPELHFSLFHRITSAPTKKAASKVSIMAVDSFILFSVC